MAMLAGVVRVVALLAGVGLVIAGAVLMTAGKTSTAIALLVVGAVILLAGVLAPYPAGGGSASPLDSGQRVYVTITVVQFAVAGSLVFVGAGLAALVIITNGSQPTVAVVGSSPSSAPSATPRPGGSPTPTPTVSPGPESSATPPPAATTTTVSPTTVSLVHDIALAIIAAGATLLPAGAAGYAASRAAAGPAPGTPPPPGPPPPGPPPPGPPPPGTPPPGPPPPGPPPPGPPPPGPPPPGPPLRTGPSAGEQAPRTGSGPPR